MSPSAVEPPDAAPSFTREAPLSRRTIWALCLLATPIAGAILYYVWRKDYPIAARYANRVSWLAWLIWLALAAAFGFLQLQRFD